MLTIVSCKQDNRDYLKELYFNFTDKEGKD